MIYPFIRRLLFLLPPETAHHVALVSLKWAHQSGLLKFFYHMPAGKTVQAMGFTFKNVVGIAAGLDKNGDYIDCLAALGVGAISVGAVTPRPQPGNPKPRLFRLVKSQGLINAMGFNNKGVDYLIEQLKKRTTDVIVDVNIGKNKETPLDRAVDDYLICLEKVFLYCDSVTVNISSPNTPGLRELQTKSYLENLLRPLVQRRDALSQTHQKILPLLVKISPDMEKETLTEMIHTLIDLSIDGIVVNNTSSSRALVKDEKYCAQAGGLSGEPIQSLSRAVLTEVVNLAKGKLTIIAVGGINSATEAKQRLATGASLVQIYTGFIYKGPRLIEDILNAL